ncbi:MAG: hypothetical protein J0H74_21785 [Chitinophagaceae bacterium]|nr:hypothetical protein [Chitinophagaceae bacterium]
MQYYIVRYTGLFGFIKPWTAVRDGETYSQQFLTPSIIGGIERKLFPELLQQKFGLYHIRSHRLSYEQVSLQQEKIQTRGWNTTRPKGTQQVLFTRPTSILDRGVLVNPVLHLAFTTKDYALIASTQHICLCRNEDILYPDQEIIETTDQDFDTNEEYFPGFELVFKKNDRSFLVGYNRLDRNKPMYGWLKIVGNPVKEF